MEIINMFIYFLFGDLLFDHISLFEIFQYLRKKCQIGENDDFICTLIRNDSIEDFVTYVNQTNLSLTSQIKPSIYETNSYLIDKEPALNMQHFLDH